MNEALQEFLKQGLQNACGWTTQAKLIWFGMGTGFGVVVSVIVAYLFKHKGEKKDG